jgi:hypothetical protein
MVLPEGLQFLKLGWWLIHVLGVLLVWSYAYRKGRIDERKARKTTTDAAEGSGARPRTDRS